MSLAIPADKIKAVLLPDGWHTVAEDSFYIDAYEYMFGDDDFYQHRDTTSGFSFREIKGSTEATIYGPYSSILAVRT